MRTSLAGRLLLGLGLTIGVTAVAAWFLGFDPTTLPPELLKIAAYKLTGIAAFGLIAAGAVVLRSAYRTERLESQQLRQRTVEALNAAQIDSMPEASVRERARERL